MEKLTLKKKKELLKKLNSFSSAQRVAWFEPVDDDPQRTADNFNLWFVFYLTNFIKHKNCEDHDKMIFRMAEMLQPHITETAIYGFREFAKTSKAKGWKTYLALYKRINVSLFGSKSDDNAREFTSDIYDNLISPKIVMDYGWQFNQRKRENTKDTQRVDEFKMRNGVVFKSFSILKPIRGLLRGHARPDDVTFDDVENILTLESPLMSVKIFKVIQEIVNGMDERNPKRLYLGNYISETGVLHKIKNMLPEDRVMIVPIYSGDITKIDLEFNKIKKKIDLGLDYKMNIKNLKKLGKITWADKYVWTEEEAIEENNNRTKRNACIPIYRLWLRKDFNQEFLQDPMKIGDREFPLLKVEKAFIKSEYSLTRKGLKIYEDVEEDTYYLIGADTSFGVGSDSNTAVILKVHKDGRLEEVASFEDNTIYGKQFGKLLIKWARHYNNAFLVPELNNTGHAVVPYLMENYLEHQIFKMEKKEHEDRPESRLFGFNTTQSSKITLIDDLSNYLHDENLIIHTEKLKNELAGYTKLQKYLKPKATDDMTNHFDLLIGLALAIQGRKQSIPYPTTAKRY